MGLGVLVELGHGAQEATLRDVHLAALAHEEYVRGRIVRELLLAQHHLVGVEDAVDNLKRADGVEAKVEQRGLLVYDDRAVEYLGVVHHRAVVVADLARLGQLVHGVDHRIRSEDVDDVEVIYIQLLLARN